MKNSEIKCKKIKDLVESNIIPTGNSIPEFGISDEYSIKKYGITRDEYNNRIKLTDAFSKFYNEMNDVKLIGTEKQIALAKKIRESKIEEYAFKMVEVIADKVGENICDYDVNKYCSSLNKKGSNNSAKFWIDNRF